MKARDYWSMFTGAGTGFGVARYFAETMLQGWKWPSLGILLLDLAVWILVTRLVIRMGQAEIRRHFAEHVFRKF